MKKFFSNQVIKIEHSSTYYIISYLTLVIGYFSNWLKIMLSFGKDLKIIEHTNFVHSHLLNNRYVINFFSCLLKLLAYFYSDIIVHFLFILDL